MRVNKKLRKLAESIGLDTEGITPEVRSLLAAFAIQHATMLDEIIKVAGRPKEPEVGSVIKFKRTHPVPNRHGFDNVESREYTYVAFNAPNGWYMTGRYTPRRPVKWVELLEFAGPDAEIQVSSGEWAAL